MSDTTQALTTQEERGVVVVAPRTVAATRWDDAELLDTIKQTLCKGATDAQFRMFIEVCKTTGLNPFLKEVYYVPEKGIIMAARDGYLRVANENPQFDGMETTVERDNNKVPIKATCRVWRKDRAHPVTCEAYFSEYKKNSPVWTQYPSAMISKVAEVLALKRSFTINGVVTEEEVGNSEERGSKEAQDAYLVSKGIEPVPPKEKRKRGGVGFDVLKHFGDIKKELAAVTGSDDQYYAILKSHNYEHANAITDNDQARDIYKVLALILKQAKEDAALKTQLELAAKEYGVEKLFPVLDAHGCKTFEDVLGLDAERLQALLTAIKGIGMAA